MYKNIIKDFDIIKLSLSSPEIIRSWSFGEVKKPETINYRTFKPERDGLFCSKIFGPIKDYECLCGKYKRIKYKGIICEKCGVEIIKSKSRRDRMGHIELASPVSHIWFLKSLPSKIGLILDISLKDIEKVLYFESYIVIKSNNNKIKVGQIISENQYTNIISNIKSNLLDFEVKMGAEAIQILLKNINLNNCLNDLNLDLNKNQSDSKRKKIIKRINLIKSFIESKNKPEWMILNVLPVLPPDIRPLVALDGGRFATSDLNDLYRRVINRNNRLKKLIDLCAPEIIIRNEKRMLQESVDSLLDNGRQDKIAVTSNKRPLKSLSDMIKGKQGRFRQNLLGKRVDYSGRSVITVGPYLKLNQCGLPKKMALELFKPFIYNKLIEKGLSNNLKFSKKILESEQPIVWDILADIIKNHPILLNRAPTLHRLGIQAFDPILIDGKAIQLHPLVCTAYNADFDGDQMAVHIPLSIEAQLESRILMMSTNNILSPANGDPVIIPSQDIILGLYYITLNIDNNIKSNIIFSNIKEVKKLYFSKIVDIHSNIKVRITEYIKNNDEEYIEKKSIVNTTVGRILLWDIFPKGLNFSLLNKCLNKKLILEIINYCYKLLGINKTIDFIDKIMYMGFVYATKSGISFGIDDLNVDFNKDKIIKEAEKEVCYIQEQYQYGLMTFEERYNKIINIWSKVSEKITLEMMNSLSKIKYDYNNSLKYYNSMFIMLDSGARGSSTQIRQLSGIRGLMTKPDGSIIETPITANFKEGLNVIQYFISTHGARKGLADTALKTANSGYLTRRLVDVAQDLVVTEYDCNTYNGIKIYNLIENGKIKENIYNKIFGRIILNDVYDKNNNILIKSKTLLDDNFCKLLEINNISSIEIRSVITCDLYFGVCSKCYGIDLSKGKIVNQGESIGVIAAQSIGEPGTQLTMRTFHIGGVTSTSEIIESNIICKHNGIIDLNNINYIKNKYNKFIVISKNSEIKILDIDNKIKCTYKIPYGSFIYKLDKDKVQIGDLLAICDNNYIPIISEYNGKSNFVDMIDNKTISYQMDELTGIYNIYINLSNSYDEKFIPKIQIIDNDNNIIKEYIIPDKSIVQVSNNEILNKGDIIAKIPQVSSLIERDITGGLPRVADLFEARLPKNPAILAEKSGIISILNIGNKKKIIIKSKESNEILHEILTNKWKKLNVLDGDFINKGDIISQGQESLQDILRLKGFNYLIEFIINEIQSIYKLQGVNINDKHIEVIIKQMLRKVTIIDEGDSDLKKYEKYDYVLVKNINKNLILNNKKIILYNHDLLGITKSSLITDSFISSASFQETTKVLTEASISGKIDLLKGLKENVIIGRLIPAGTGYYINHKKD